MSKTHDAQSLAGMRKFLRWHIKTCILWDNKESNESLLSTYWATNYIGTSKYCNHKIVAFNCNNDNEIHNQSQLLHTLEPDSVSSWSQTSRKRFRIHWSLRCMYTCCTNVHSSTIHSILTTLMRHYIQHSPCFSYCKPWKAGWGLRNEAILVVWCDTIQ